MLHTCCFIHLDDNAEELLSLREAAGKTGLPFQISQFFSVEPVLDYIAGNGSFKDRHIHPVPAFLLLDYDLGEIPGPDVVREIRHLRGGKLLPIIVYKEFLHDGDAVLCDGTGADHLLAKPESLWRQRIMMGTLYNCAMSVPPDFAALSELEEGYYVVARRN